MAKGVKDPKATAAVKGMLKKMGRNDMPAVTIGSKKASKGKPKGKGC